MHAADAMIAALTARQRAHAGQIQRLWEMTAHERCVAMCRGELTPAQLFEWAAQCPQEVPLIDGEFAFIAAYTPEVEDRIR